jgi:hypothetical protein
MRWLLTIFLALACGTARCDDVEADTIAAPGIVAVLCHSQQVRLDAMNLADGSGLHARTVRDSFDLLQRRLRIAPPVVMRVIGGEVAAETLHGDIVVANETLANLPEGERLFVLAHEPRHVVLGHWGQMVQVCRQWEPGTVTQQQTDGVAKPLGREASALAHRQQFEADAFGLRAVRRLGLSEQDAVAAVMDLGMRNETATHPGTQKRGAARRGARSNPIERRRPRRQRPSAERSSGERSARASAGTPQADRVPAWRVAPAGRCRVHCSGGQPERAHRLLKATRLALQGLRRSGQLLDQRGILLCHRVDLRDRMVHLAEIAAL